jgi:hypothetical protein
MYLAVSAGLNRIVSVRNTWITPDGRYPLRFPCGITTSKKLRGSDYEAWSNLVTSSTLLSHRDMCSDFPPREITIHYVVRVILYIAYPKQFLNIFSYESVGL